MYEANKKNRKRKRRKPNKNEMDPGEPFGPTKKRARGPYFHFPNRYPFFFLSPADGGAHLPD
jgi:hypothetical protein